MSFSAAAQSTWVTDTKYQTPIRYFQQKPRVAAMLRRRYSATDSTLIALCSLAYAIVAA